jgi:IS30 family transposase
MSQESITCLSQRERYLIEIKLNAKEKIYQIARDLNRNPSTIYREIKRSGLTLNNYNSLQAENEYSKRRLKKKKKLKENRLFNKNPNLFKKILKDLKQKYSPIVIANTTLKNKVSYGTIYNHLYYLAKLGGKEYLYLYNKHRKRKKHTKHCKTLIPNRVSIHERDEIVETKKRFGDFELDLIKLPKGYLISIVDRKTRRGLIEKVTSKKAEKVSHKVIKMLSKYKGKIKTITTDNGLEFAKHEKIAKQLNCKIYFCDPYCSSQKGAIENFNKMVRKYLSKEISYKQLTKLKLKQIIDSINNYPRAILNFKSANEVFNKSFVATTF